MYYAKRKGFFFLASLSVNATRQERAKIFMDCPDEKGLTSSRVASHATLCTEDNEFPVRSGDGTLASRLAILSSCLTVQAFGDADPDGSDC